MIINLKNIPCHPNTFYKKKGWINFPDFIGHTRIETFISLKKFPEVLKLFSSKNGTNTKHVEFNKHARIKYLWDCNKCGNTYENYIINMIKGNLENKCPFCKTLYYKWPELVKLLHPDKNKHFDPKIEVSVSSKQNITLLYKCGCEYTNTVDYIWRYFHRYCCCGNNKCINNEERYRENIKQKYIETMEVSLREKYNLSETDWKDIKKNMTDIYFKSIKMAVDYLNENS